MTNRPKIPRHRWPCNPQLWRRLNSDPLGGVWQFGASQWQIERQPHPTALTPYVLFAPASRYRFGPEICRTLAEAMSKAEARATTDEVRQAVQLANSRPNRRTNRRPTAAPGQRELFPPVTPVTRPSDTPRLAASFDRPNR